MTATIQKPKYSLADLEALTGVSGRTIRYYITLGLLPPAHGRGPSATYDQEHLNRLQVILLLREQHIPLAEIGTRLAELSPRQIATMVEGDTRPVGEAWRRIALHPNIELHYREPADGRDEELQDAVQLILDLSGPIVQRLEERR
ncbi:MAG TPA: MerR family transcriptional regulator [Thermomicrobiales bacterium]|nr:MerR family transcriptional regulator [Thermomicrobiales bacterium]